SRMSEAGKAIFAKLRDQDHMKLVALMQSLPPSAPSSSVKSIECCTVSGWLSAPDYWRQWAQGWDYVPDDNPLPEKLAVAISTYFKKKGITIRKPTMAKLQRFLNHLWNHKNH